jgi:hypothetical protein
MMEALVTAWHSPYVQLAIAGWVVAARVDYNAFVSFKSLHDAAEYDWKVAGWRWFQGAMMGVLGAKLFA